MWVLVGGGDLWTPRFSAARSRSDRWAVEGTERSDGGAGVPAGPGGVDPVGERSGGADSPARIGRVHRALAVEPSLHSDPGRAAERKLGLFWPLWHCGGRRPLRWGLQVPQLRGAPAGPSIAEMWLTRSVAREAGSGQSGVVQ